MEFKVHHVGYAVPDLAKAIDEFAALGWHVSSEVTDDVLRQVRIIFMTMGTSVVELVAPMSPASPITKQLAKGSGAPYHICYEVDSLETAESELKAKKFIVFKKPAVASAIDGRRVEFLYAKNNGVIELVEK